MLSNSLLFTLLSALFAASWRISHKLLVKETKSDLAFTAITEFFAFITLGIIFLFTKDYIFNVNLTLIYWLIFSAILSAFGDYLVLYANKNADVSDAAILMPLSNVWVFIFGILLLGESLTLGKIIGIPLIILGSVITLWTGKKILLNKGIIAAIIYGVVITGTILIDKKTSGFFGPILYAMIFYFISSVTLTLLAVIKEKNKIFKELRLNVNKSLIIGVQWALFTFFLLTAYGYDEASRVVPLMRVFIVFVTIFSVFILGEKERFWKKITGSVIVTVGAIFLSLLS